MASAKRVKGAAERESARESARRSRERRRSVSDRWEPRERGDVITAIRGGRVVIDPEAMAVLREMAERMGK